MSTHLNTEVRHGGDLHTAIERYGGPASQWLDLSTGISPWSYPIPPFDKSTWHCLPDNNKTLLTSASNYYGCDSSQIITTPGSQLAIRLIPQILDKKQSVAIPLIGYQEHAVSWQIAGHAVLRYRDKLELRNLVDKQAVSSVVTINPNNPTGEVFSTKFLRTISANLTGILLVDEAFSDLDDSRSMLSTSDSIENVVILKSIGKFFGLAGARVGFAIGDHSVVEKLNQLLAPWSIAGPAIKVATSALDDTQWQAKQRARIITHAHAQSLVLNSIAGLLPDSKYNDQGLFFSIFAQSKAITRLHTHLAERRIWARLGDTFVGDNRRKLNWLRLSLAANQLDRLSSVLKSANINSYPTTSL